MSFFPCSSCTLSSNPLPELGVDRVLLRHAAVTELCLVFTQLLEEVAPMRVMRSLIIRCIEIRRWWLSCGFGRSGYNIIVTKKEKEEIEKPLDRKHRGTNSNITHQLVRTPPLCSPHPMHRRWWEAPCVSWRFVMEAN